MDKIAAILNELMTETLDQINYVTTEIKSCPDGMLSYYNRKGKYAVYCETRTNGNRIRKTITYNKDMQIKLAKKIVLQKKYENAAAVKEIISDLLKQAEKKCDFDYAKYCREKFPYMDEELISKVMKGYEALDEWSTQPYEQSAFKPEDRTKYTSRGLAVRSKSELLIAEMLYKYNIAFHYEEVLVIDNIRYAPDFTIRRADGKMFYWEHMGMMNNPLYIQRQYNKEEAYRNVGIVPWDNLIKTYDSANGDINIRIIESEIRNKLFINI